MTDEKMSVVASVRVRELSLLADIGINPDEVGRRQPLVISVELLLATSNPETIGDTVDYRRVAAAAEGLAKVHIPLIETFAYRLGSELIGWDKVIEARVDIDKPFALTRGTAGVRVVVRRGD